MKKAFITNQPVNPVAVHTPTLNASEKEDRAKNESQAQFRELMEHLHQVFWIKNEADNAVLYVNPAYEKVWGRSCQSLYDNYRTLEEAIHPDDRDRMARVKSRKHETNGYDEEYRIIRPDGEVRWICGRSYPVGDGKGVNKRFATISEDITNRKRAEKERSRFAAIIECSQDVSVSMTLEGIIIGWNQAAERQYGYLSEEIIGRSIGILFPADHYQEYLDLLKKVRNGESVPSYETVRRKKNGVLTNVSVEIIPIETKDGEIIGASKIGHDITKIKKLEAQFIEAQKMEVVGQLAGGIAHDFNNILAIIMGYTGIIFEAAEVDSELRNYAEQIQQAAERAAGLTRQLLVFSSKQIVDTVILDLNDVVSDLDKMLRRLVNENIDMKVILTPEAGRIKADAGYLGQVVMNLVVNARDAMPAGGTLTIQTTNVIVDKTLEKPSGSWVVLSISDTGTGMSQEVKEHLFEAFFTTKPKGKGTGLGLATCQTIVKQCGGHIEVQSEIGKGTTFNIYFPKVEEPLAVTPPKGNSIALLPRGDETLLVVEDDVPLRSLISSLLTRLGYQVMLASNGQDALRVAAERVGSPISLVVTDIIMPVLGGTAMAESLKKTSPELKILFTSGHTDDIVAHLGDAAAGISFLPKPYTPSTIAHKVRSMLDT